MRLMASRPFERSAAPHARAMAQLAAMPTAGRTRVSRGVIRYHQAMAIRYQGAEVNRNSLGSSALPLMRMIAAW